MSIVFLSVLTPATNANADGGGSCNNVKLGNDYIPKSPNLLVATGSRYKVSATKIEWVRALYQSGSELEISWSRWKELDQAQETLFYDSYVLYQSTDKGLTWGCSTISAARFFFNLTGLIQDTDYDFALTATDGSVWAPPTYFSASTNLSKRPVLKKCIPEDFNPILQSLGANLLTILPGLEQYGRDLPLKWTYSENNWKSLKTYKTPWDEIFVSISSPVLIPYTRYAKQVEVKVTPNADKTPKNFQSIAYSGYTSAGCKAQTFKIDIKKKTLVRR